MAVVTKRGVQIGYVTSERAPQIGLLLRNGHVLQAIFQEQTNWGCLIRVGVDERPVLPARRPSAPNYEDADYDPGFETDWIPPDD